MSLKTDYKDAELASSMSGKRQYEITTNSAGYSVLTDKSAYTEVGDTFGADDINTTNSKVNEIESSLNNKAGKWTFLGNATGYTNITLPSSFEELLIITEIPFSSYPLGTSLNILKSTLTSNIRYFDAGSLRTLVRYAINTSNITLNSSNAEGVDLASTTATKVYYR